VFQLSSGGSIKGNAAKAQRRVELNILRIFPYDPEIPMKEVPIVCSVE
jgi:hypothetical protein